MVLIADSGSVCDKFSSRTPSIGKKSVQFITKAVQVGFQNNPSRFFQTSLFLLHQFFGTVCVLQGVVYNLGLRIW